MGTQQKPFFATDTASLSHRPRKTFAEMLESPEKNPLTERAKNQTLVEHLMSIYMAPFTKGFTPLW